MPVNFIISSLFSAACGDRTGILNNISQFAYAFHGDSGFFFCHKAYLAGAPERLCISLTKRPILMQAEKKIFLSMFQDDSLNWKRLHHFVDWCSSAFTTFPRLLDFGTQP
jgi:hypothetical protein